MAQGDSNWAGFPWAGSSPQGLGQPVDPDAPTPIIEQFGEALNGRLGCGTPSAFISFRCNATFCDLPEDAITHLQWSRRLNEVSEAEVTVRVSGDSFSACCECLAEVEPWCHELHIWRDGSEVWVGPIQQIVYSYEEVRIIAKDVLAWTEVFIPPGDLDYTDTVAFPLGYDLASIAEDIVTLAYVDNDFSCELNHLYVDTDASCVNNLCGYRFFPGFTGSSFEFLDALGDTGVLFTTIGRTIYISAPRNGQPANLQRLALLTDEHIVGDITVTKDGDLQGNRFYVHWDGDLGVPEVSSAANMYCSGPVERLREGEGLVTEDDAQDAADSYVANQTIAPRIVEIPTGSRLSAETPIQIHQLVPGATFDVSVTKMCVSLVRSFRLVGIEVEYSPEDGEQVTIDMAPVNLPEG